MELRCGKSLEKYPEIIGRLASMVERYLEVLRCVGAAWISDGSLEDLPKPSRVGKTRVGGIDINQSRLRAVMDAVLALSPAPQGFSASQVAAQVGLHPGHEGYSPRQAAYDLKKLRGKDWVARYGGSRRYQATPQGLRAMAALVTLLDKVIKPLLAGADKRRLETMPDNPHPIDRHYEAIQREMRDLFNALGLAA